MDMTESNKTSMIKAYSYKENSICFRRIPWKRPQVA